MHPLDSLNETVIYDRPFHVGAFTVVPTCSGFVLLVVPVLFPIMFVSLLRYVCIPESPPIWERAADSVYHRSDLFTSCCNCFPLFYCGRNLGSNCISS